MHISARHFSHAHAVVRCMYEDLHEYSESLKIFHKSNVRKFYVILFEIKPKMADCRKIAREAAAYFLCGWIAQRNYAGC